MPLKVKTTKSVHLTSPWPFEFVCNNHMHDPFSVEVCHRHNVHAIWYLAKFIVGCNYILILDI